MENLDKPFTNALENKSSTLPIKCRMAEDCKKDVCVAFRKSNSETENAITSGIDNDGIKNLNYVSHYCGKSFDMNSRNKGDNDNFEEKKSTDPIIMINRALCANYRSGSDSSSIDSDDNSDSEISSSSSFDTLSGNDCRSSLNKKGKTKPDCDPSAGDFFMHDLPPIEKLKISLPEQSCLEIGLVTSIVGTLVIVESYKGTAALDVDTVLFLESGKKALGKVFEILGPISEPVYAVRFNSSEDILANNIVKGLKVYYAPETQHTNFVLLSDVLKCRGSDASWKDNIEAPSEFQDFSDDEEERKFKNKSLLQNNGTFDFTNRHHMCDSRKRRLDNQSLEKPVTSNRSGNVSHSVNKFQHRLARRTQPNRIRFPVPPLDMRQSDCFPYFYNSHIHNVPFYQQTFGYLNLSKATCSGIQNEESFSRVWPPLPQRQRAPFVRNSWPVTNEFSFVPPPPPPVPDAGGLSQVIPTVSKGTDNIM